MTSDRELRALDIYAEMEVAQGKLGDDAVILWLQHSFEARRRVEWQLYLKKHPIDDHRTIHPPYRRARIARR